MLEEIDGQLKGQGTEKVLALLHAENHVIDELNR
jgi:hypothetical protein